jgi:hypothetical protein
MRAARCCCNIVGAVVLGGTRLPGRTGRLLGLQDFDQQMVTGAFIFLAAAADRSKAISAVRIGGFRKTRSTGQSGLARFVSLG